MTSPSLEMERLSEAPEPEEPENLTEEVLFEILANPRRRTVLRELSRNETYEIGILAECVAGAENGTAAGDVASEERKSAYTALQQLHLPKLHSAGLVVYDKDRGTVEPTLMKEEINIYLDVVRGNDIPWHEYYFALGVVSLLLVVVAAFDVFPFGLFPDIGWAALIVLSFLISASLHYRSQAGTGIGIGRKPEQ
ncbi:DUF7344 domain-containing protein [Halobellus clavatus]|nr:helix-turn-helix transcriptional regulator [Halobellus clavatus]